MLRSGLRITSLALMDGLVLIPVAAYLALHLVKIRPIARGVWPAITLWMIGLICAAVVLTRMPSRWFYPDNDALQRVTKEGARLQSRELRRNDVVLLIEGSSLVTCDVRAADLEKLLRDRGLPVRVMQVSAGGSNHFERVALFREWLRGLTPAQAASLRRARVFLLAEVLYVYDYLPLHGFAENAFGSRSVAYASPENVFPMIGAVWTKFRAGAASPALIPLIVEHGFFHAFRVGAFPCVRPPVADYSVNGGQGIAMAVAGPRENKRAVVEKAAVPYPWWHHGREAQENLLTGWVDEAGYLALPTHQDLEPIYKDRFFAALPGQTFRIDGTKSLPGFGAKHWADKSHLNAEGARVFTAWLAGEIAANWPRIANE